MPPKKRLQRQSRKAQLLFHQPPLEGAKHHYDSLQQPITHTVQVPSKPIDQGTITSWVLPQFDTKAESQFPAHRKHRPRDQARHLTRRSTCKFPRLTFESPPSSSSETLLLSLNREEPCQAEKDTPRRPLVPLLSPQSCGDLSVHALQSLSHVFMPPDIQTPGSSVREDPVSPDQKENSLAGCILGPTTPNSPEPGPVLVKDTPEEKYGIKVTWRRRRHLFAYLKEKGKLDKSQFLVKI
ncbi:RAD9, HUS1, RAD1-interacting nuclear orphan protein 1 [Peromyscus maniculatus bairdii]|uniref:RAD9-HUS1-RAD1 interacting nuclear orphan 1 n=1 Tax=Peromyscus maniculatus bairdii TaxID=230844 RepID=A0A6J0E8K6_PERMB|nr:RAD9, HUS1, RAD1-interacting nuclear orphan protein 1 [Peromyscus maniculatus bairdii]XP_006987925.1 RAD9, HUS1, RAD1-interacting nuclear orphan protein 1 [Peromyscus maniculatus bairdii]XP_015861877.1 RAD9, HUS1, RAD1-interacting nuclear orphan protein 1 [Peromyscus maniculatus bairdii]XP_042130101.1 RAD9, HUS1, RAD1-interacting nuclear orphan protein 1 [Peromyscus maniculatus bairdii]XP_042130102.1 RAD9, HUS1, RAD1-interacting nuclear orphan protein 1 [Peromyscus maniculatus bairdii]XP_04